MKNKFIDYYMNIAEKTGELSSAIRLHVGAIIVKDDRVISIGYNGMPSGWTNECENREYMSSDAGGWLSLMEINQTWPSTDENGMRYKLVTKREVLHAETNAIAKLAKSTESGDKATLFVTHAPCIDCAKLVYQSGISTVYYKYPYRDDLGLQFLIKAGVKVERV